MTEPTLRDCINYMKQQLKGMEKYPKSYEFNIPYYRKTIEYLEEGRPHGEWIWKEYDPDYDCGDIVCSKCSVVIYEGVPQARLKVVKWPFCPDCGADMREGDSDA